MFAYFSKNWQFYKKNIFLHNHPKTLFFWAFFEIFLFHFFHGFSFSFSNIQKTKTKSAHFFSKTLFLTPWQTAKKIFSHPYTLFVFFKMPKKHYKTGENKQKKSWTKFWRNLGPSFDSKKPKSWTKFWLYSIYIYMRCEVIIWAKFGHFRCYYLGQVGVIIWAKLFLAYKNSGFKRFLAHTVIILCFFGAQLSGNYLKIAFFPKKGAKIVFFNFLCFKFIFWKFFL